MVQSVKHHQLNKPKNIFRITATFSLIVPTFLYLPTLYHQPDTLPARTRKTAGSLLALKDSTVSRCCWCCWSKSTTWKLAPIGSGSGLFQIFSGKWYLFKRNSVYQVIQAVTWKYPWKGHLSIPQGIARYISFKENTFLIGFCIYIYIPCIILAPLIFRCWCLQLLYLTIYIYTYTKYLSLSFSNILSENATHPCVSYPVFCSLPGASGHPPLCDLHFQQSQVP